MKKLKITLTPVDANRKFNPYRKRETNELMFVYNVEGSVEELAAYKVDQPRAITDEKTGKVLYFSKVSLGKESEIIRNAKGGWFADTMKEELFASFCKIGGIEYAKMKMAELG